ncbi:MAG: hypothetical protein AMJ79_04370, partial [Phycisphaerae bacterium SM23_30]
RFVVADIPGLIEGSHQGQGLGHDFLRHIERTRLIVHLVDIAAPDGSDPLKNYHTIRHELSQYSEVLAAKPEIIVAAKMDLDPDAKKLHAFSQGLGFEVRAISAVTGNQIPQLCEHLWQEVQKVRAEEKEGNF